MDRFQLPGNLWTEGRHHCGNHIENEGLSASFTFLLPLRLFRRLQFEYFVCPVFQ